MDKDHTWLTELSSATRRALRCPICRSPVEMQKVNIECVNAKCRGVFPIVGNLPVLINDTASLFSVEDFLRQRGTFFTPRQGKIVEFVKRRIPTITRNVSVNQNFNTFARLLLESSSNPKVLILGGSILGEGMESLLSYGQLELIETDVSFGPRTKLICDAHDIPFVEGFFDGVVVQAVLEHVVDPYRCVDEIHRVLKEGGLVLADTPFMQQVHGGRYDFTRFTHLGHRRLFRKFEEIASGVSCGPSVALAWACEYFLLSFAQTHFVRRLIRLAIWISLSPLKYVDYYLANKPGALDVLADMARSDL